MQDMTLINLHYEIDKLIKRIQLETLSYTKNVNPDDTSVMDELAVSTNDYAYVRSLIKDVAKKILFSLNRYKPTDTEITPFEFDATYTKDEDSTENCIIYRLEFPDKWNDLLMDSLDNSIENAIVNYTTSEFLFRNRADGTYHARLFERDKSDIIASMSNRAGLKRTYKLY